MACPLLFTMPMDSSFDEITRKQIPLGRMFDPGPLLFRIGTLLTLLAALFLVSLIRYRWVDLSPEVPLTVLIITAAITMGARIWNVLAPVNGDLGFGALRPSLIVIELFLWAVVLKTAFYLLDQLSGAALF